MCTSRQGMSCTVKPRYNAVAGRHLLGLRYKRGAIGFSARVLPISVITERVVLRRDCMFSRSYYILPVG